MPGDLDRRLRTLEAQAPASDPFSVLVMVRHEGTTVSVCWSLPDSRTDTLTLGEYRTRYREQYRDRERWYIHSTAEPIEDRLCKHWWDE